MSGQATLASVADKFLPHPSFYDTLSILRLHHPILDTRRYCFHWSSTTCLKTSSKYETPPIHDMPRAKVGTSKYVANMMRSKGLQRLRWYCQVCEKQCRDENGFKCHTQSESHVRNIMAVSSNPNKKIEEFSREFKNDFIRLLRTSHGTKSVHINHFYQKYIAEKEHIHMNATKWPSLTDFAKFLGREGICRVEENEKGLHIAWIDNSTEALRKQDALRRQEAMEKGDEEREQRMIDETSHTTS